VTFDVELDSCRLVEGAGKIAGESLYVYSAKTAESPADASKRSQAVLVPLDQRTALTGRASRAGICGVAPGCGSSPNPRGHGGYPGAFPHYQYERIHTAIFPLTDAACPLMPCIPPLSWADSNVKRCSANGFQPPTIAAFSVFVRDDAIAVVDLPIDRSQPISKTSLINGETVPIADFFD
jgi:hypothetical protein